MSLDELIDSCHTASSKTKRAEALNRQNFTMRRVEMQEGTASLGRGSGKENEKPAYDGAQELPKEEDEKNEES